MFNFWGSKDQQGQSRPPPEVSSSSQQQHPWYSPSLVSSPSSSSRPQTSGQIPAHVSPGEAAGIITFLKDKSVDELRKLLSDKDAYQPFLLSLDQVKIQNNIKEELRRETLQLAKAMNEVDEESEALQEKFLEKEIDTAAFVQKYKKLRTIYHRRALIHLAAKTSTIG
ncbi:hypothetical protein F2Q69_00015437 [Brassica cretica]|uniref:VPS37 C-terminal domain-containing protein n=1 Tax=Brassica cretica TaxID=69181 RepID=A0A8S9QQ72_BRACR|nr:hypothetical protein F2Q69_00015437 [Brassica cretica]